MPEIDRRYRAGGDCVRLVAMSVETAEAPAAAPDGDGPRRSRNRPLRGDRRPRAAQAAPGDVPSRRCGPDARALHHRRRLPGGHGRRGVRRPRARGGGRVRSRPGVGRVVGAIRRHRCGSQPTRRRLQDPGRRDPQRRGGGRRRAELAPLPLAAAECARRGDRGPRGGRGSPAGATGSSSRSRSGPTSPRRDRWTSVLHGDLRGAADLPHRPLPWAGRGPEPPRDAVRQRHVRAGVEPEPHQSRPDRRSRDPRDRHAGQPSTSRPAPFGTWSSPTSSRCSASSRWSRRTHSTRSR